MIRGQDYRRKQTVANCGGQGINRLANALIAVAMKHASVRSAQRVAVCQLEIFSAERGP
jgi:hypothetical protein